MRNFFLMMQVRDIRMSLIQIYFLTWLHSKFSMHAIEKESPLEFS